MTKKQYTGISEIDYWDKLKDDDKQFLKQFLVDEYCVGFKGIKPKNRNKDIYKKDYYRRNDFFNKYNKKNVKDLEKTVNAVKGDLDLDNTLNTLTLDFSFELMKIANNIGRGKMGLVLEAIKDIVLKSETNDFAIIKMEVKNYLDNLIERSM